VRDPEVEGAADDGPLHLEPAVAAEVLPEPQRKEFDAAGIGSPERIFPYRPASAR
jgi:hypothetical protein